MSGWTYVDTDEDKDELMKKTMGFHDAYIVGLEFMPGTFVCDEGTFLGGPGHKRLKMVFASEWFEEPLEVIFEDVRRFNVAGSQNKYSDEIFECSLSFRNDLYSGSDEQLILWTDGGYPKQQNTDELLTEPVCTYVISKKMRWRFAGLKYKCPCCGYYTFTKPPTGEFENCPVCCWFDDLESLYDVNYVSEATGISLREARRNFIKTGACSEKFISEVRQPSEDELEGIEWITPL